MKASFAKPRGLPWDGLGVAASSLCLAHCLLLPVFTTFLPVLGTQFLGVVLGLVASVFGLRLSFKADLPTGATVVGVLGLLPLVAAFARPWRKIEGPR